MKCFVLAAVLFLVVYPNHSMEKGSEKKKSQSFVVKKIIGLGKDKSVNRFLFYNESEYIFVISNGQEKKVIEENGTNKNTIKQRVSHPLIIKTGDLSESLTIDVHKKGVQRYKISATTSAITITEWPIES